MGARRAVAAVAVAVAVLGGVLLAAAGGCARRGAPPAPSGGGRVVRDGLGRDVALPPAVARVVSLAPSTTEILFAVGAGPLVVGVDRYSDFPPEVRRLPQLGADVDPNLERIVALRPDLVFTATTANTRQTAETLERLGLRVYVSRAGTLEDVEADIAGVGAAAGRAAEAERIAAAMRDRFAAARARCAGRPPVRTLVVVWPDPLVVAGRGSHIEEVVRAACGENVAADSTAAFPSYSVERVLARAPEVIVVGTHAGGGPPSLAALERLTTLPAVRDRRIHIVDGDLLFRPGPRLLLGLDQLARLLAPPP